MMSSAPKAAFSDPVMQSQRVFRAAMMAMSRPGHLQDIGVDLGPPAPLAPAAAALALTLCDFETPVWLDARLGQPEILRWLRFETAAPVVASPHSAAIAMIGDPMAMPGLESFSLGSLENPETSATLIIQVESLHNDGGWTLAGPGIAGQMQLHASPLPAACIGEMMQMRSRFPRGVDIFFACGRQLAALPRSVLIEA